MDFNEMNANVIAEFRANAGKVGGWFEGQDVILVHTVGAKTGAARVNPLVCLDKGDRLIIFASKGGMPDNPDWYYNLKANPQVTMEIGTETLTGVASEIMDDAERDRLYAEQVKRMPGFAEYEKSTTRRIPVIAIDRS